SAFAGGQNGGSPPISKTWPLDSTHFALALWSAAMLRRFGLCRKRSRENAFAKTVPTGEALRTWAGRMTFRSSANSRCLSACAQNKPIVFAILEHGISAPRLLLRRTFELNPAFAQLVIGLVNVLAFIRHVHERTDALFVAFGR